MHASELIRSFELDSSEILKDPENYRLLRTLTDFSIKLKRYGLNVAICNHASLQKLAELNSDQKTQIREYFENWGIWIEPETSGDSIIEVGFEQEKTFLKRALDHYGFWIHDEFWKSISHGQVIEFYGKNMVQLYRNLHFFQFSSYSLLEISVFEWYQLWQRPSVIQDTMMKTANHVMTHMTPLLVYGAPRHVLRETRDMPDRECQEHVACLVQFKYAGSLCRGLERTPVGAIAVSEAELIAVGEEALQIQFV